MMHVYFDRLPSWHSCLSLNVECSTFANAYDNCRGDEVKPCAELEKEERVQLLKVQTSVIFACAAVCMCCGLLCHGQAVHVILLFCSVPRCCATL